MEVRGLGRVTYDDAAALQAALARQSGDQYLLLLEHPPTYTLGVRADPAHVLVDPDTVGAVLRRADRGGDVTYHGPGQLVVYPIRTVVDHPGAGPAHVAELEDIVIGALRDVGAPDVGRLSGYPGVWLGVAAGRPKKVAAVGVRTAREGDRCRTRHGVAINVAPDMGMFAHIVPCGIADLPVTSLAAEGITADLATVADAVVARAAAVWAPGGVERHDVVHGPSGVRGGSSLERRARQAGLDPAAGLALSARKPEWLRVPTRRGQGFQRMDRALRDLELVTVCEEAGCPNIYECWSDGTATFMINGERCTRACAFCLVDTRRPAPLDPAEPERVGRAVERLGLAHAVVTCVARDDLADGGSGAMVATIRAIRRHRPGAAVEVLISDYQGDPGALAAVCDERPDVLNHNLETVARLQRAVRPSASYARSLAVLSRASAAGLTTKSGVMVGLGESPGELRAALRDLRAVGVSIVTVGQYLRPTAQHLPVARWWQPEEFAELADYGRSLGFAHVEASPLTRSSYHARAAASAAAPGRVPVQLTSR